MPPLTRWFIKAALASLVLALLTRATMAVLPNWKNIQRRITLRLF